MMNFKVLGRKMLINPQCEAVHH